MSMTSTGIGATLFAVGVAQLPATTISNPGSRQRSIATFRDALVRNINGKVTQTTAPPLAVPVGDQRKLVASESIEASGRDSGGRSVRLTARFFIVDDRLFQLVALAAEGEIPPDALETFFTSFRLVQLELSGHR